MAANFEEVQLTLEAFMKKFSDKKTKKKFKLLEDLKIFLFTEPQPFLNLDQIDYLLIGDESEEIMGLCQMCNLKSNVMKTIKRSSSGALQLIHSMLFDAEYFLRDQIQDEFRGLEAGVFINMDLGAHFKEYAKLKKGSVNPPLDILVFIKSKRKNLPLKQLIPKEDLMLKVEKLIEEKLESMAQQAPERRGKGKKGKKGNRAGNGSGNVSRDNMSQEIDEDSLDTESAAEGGQRGKGKGKKKKKKLRSKEPARWIDINLEADKKYFNVIGDETGVASLNEDAKVNLNDYSSIEIIDPITQQPLKNLNLMVETTQQLESIHIQSPMFDPQQYLLTVHKDTDSGLFHEGIKNVKAKLRDQTSLATKKDLVVNNYGQFLAAKMTLDDINKKFLSTQESNEFLDDLEEAMKSLRVKAQLKLRPLVENLEKINDCVMTNQAVKQIMQLLKINRMIHLAVIEEDKINKGIEIIQRERGAINRAQMELQLRNQKSNNHGSNNQNSNNVQQTDIRGEALEKVLYQLERTFKKTIERVGQKIISLSTEQIQSQGLEQYQGYLEILFSLISRENQSLKLRRNAVDFILQSLKDRLMDLIDTNVQVNKGKEGGLNFQNTFKRMQSMNEFIEIRKDMSVLIQDDDQNDDENNQEDYNGDGQNQKYSEKDVKDILFPRDYQKLYLEVNSRQGLKSKQTPQKPQQSINNKPQVLQNLGQFQLQFLSELNILHTFIKANTELIALEMQDRFINEIISKLRESLQKLLFIKLKANHIYKNEVHAQDIIEVTKFECFINDNISAEDSVQISLFLQAIIDLEESYNKKVDDQGEKLRTIASKQLSDVLDQIQQAAVNNLVCNAFGELNSLKINPLLMGQQEDDQGYENGGGLDFGGLVNLYPKQSGGIDDFQQDQINMLSATSLSDLESYFTKTWHRGRWIQIPIFIYGFFNTLSMEIYKFRQMIGKSKLEINHRQVGQIIGDCCLNIVKSMIIKLQEMIEERKNETENQQKAFQDGKQEDIQARNDEINESIMMTQSAIGEILVMLSGLEQIQLYGLTLLKDQINQFPQPQEQNKKKDSKSQMQKYYKDQLFMSGIDTLVNQTIEKQIQDYYLPLKQKLIEHILDQALSDQESTKLKIETENQSQLFDLSIMDQIYSQVPQQQSFREVRSYVYEIISFLQYSLLEIYQVFPSLNQKDDYQSELQYHQTNDFLIENLYILTLRTFANTFQIDLQDQRLTLISQQNESSNQSSNGAFKSKESQTNNLILLELKQRLFEIDFLGDVLLSNTAFNVKLEPALEECRTAIYAQLKQHSIGKDGIQEIINEDDEDYVNANSDEEIDDQVNQKTFHKKNPDQLFEIDFLTNEEIEQKKKSIRDLKFKSEYNLGGVFNQ